MTHVVHATHVFYLDTYKFQENGVKTLKNSQEFYEISSKLKSLNSQMKPLLKRQEILKKKPCKTQEENDELLSIYFQLNFIKIEFKTLENRIRNLQKKLRK